MQSVRIKHVVDKGRQLLVGDGIDAGIACVDIVEAQIFHLHAHKDACDARIAIKSQGIGSRQVGFDALYFLIAEALFPHPAPFILHDGNRLCDLAIVRRKAARDGFAVIAGRQVGSDAIGQAPFHTHLFHQAVVEAATTQHLHGKIGFEKALIVSWDAILGEDDDGLGRVERHHGYA